MQEVREAKGHGGLRWGWQYVTTAVEGGNKSSATSRQASPYSLALKENFQVTFPTAKSEGPSFSARTAGNEVNI